MRLDNEKMLKTMNDGACIHKFTCTLVKLNMWSQRLRSDESSVSQDGKDESDKGRKANAACAEERGSGDVGCEVVRCGGPLYGLLDPLRLHCFQ